MVTLMESFHVPSGPVTRLVAWLLSALCVMSLVGCVHGKDGLHEDELTVKALQVNAHELKAKGQNAQALYSLYASIVADSENHEGFVAIASIYEQEGCINLAISRYREAEIIIELKISEKKAGTDKTLDIELCYVYGKLAALYRDVDDDSLSKTYHKKYLSMLCLNEGMDDVMKIMLGVQSGIDK